MCLVGALATGIKFLLRQVQVLFQFTFLSFVDLLFSLQQSFKTSSGSAYSLKGQEARFYHLMGNATSSNFSTHVCSIVLITLHKRGSSRKSLLQYRDSGTIQLKSLIKSGTCQMHSN